MKSFMANILGLSSTIVTSCVFRSEPQLVSKFTAVTGSIDSSLWLSCIQPRNYARNHFQLKCSNGHPLNAASSHDGVFLILIFIILYRIHLLCYVVLDIMKLNLTRVLGLTLPSHIFNASPWIEMVVHTCWMLTDLAVDPALHGFGRGGHEVISICFQ